MAAAHAGRGVYGCTRTVCPQHTSTITTHTHTHTCSITTHTQLYRHVPYEKRHKYRISGVYPILPHLDILYTVSVVMRLVPTTVSVVFVCFLENSEQRPYPVPASRRI